jgi:hypothetical protein
VSREKRYLAGWINPLREVKKRENQKEEDHLIKRRRV